MLQTTLTPQSAVLSIPIPDNFVGKKVEVWLYLPDESSVPIADAETRNVQRFKGLLTAQEADKFQSYLQKTRQEWNRDI
ncbi:hypothetical protein FACS1894199_16820 [Bacteroidia bacterium]|nr:hypothetical protein FACS1894199_16820 [Bacteroidia bacterium]